MKGTRKLKDIYSTVNHEAIVVVKSTSEKTLYDEKITALTARYYYYQYITKKQNFNEILLILENEFFISSRRIVDILNAQIPAVQKLKKLAPKTDWFRQKWAHLTW